MKVCSGELSREELVALLNRAAVDILTLEARVAELEATRPKPMLAQVREYRRMERLAARMGVITEPRGGGRFIRPVFPQQQVAS